MGLQCHVRVGHEGRDAISRANARGTQRPSQAATPIMQFGVGEGALAINHGHPVAEDQCAAVEEQRRGQRLGAEDRPGHRDVAVWRLRTRTHGS